VGIIRKQDPALLQSANLRVDGAIAYLAAKCGG
jgi:hypothetical protein